MSKFNKRKRKFDIYEGTTNQIVGILEKHRENQFKNTWFSTRVDSLKTAITLN